MSKPSLYNNSFYVLGATTRDNKARIIELAEEKSLIHNDETCQNARAEIINPRSRLAVEISWFPGISPRKIAQTLIMIEQQPLSIRDEDSLPILAHLNFMAFAFTLLNNNTTLETVSDYIQQICYLFEELDSTDILRDINEDRHVSGFPEMTSVDLIDEELTARKKFYRTVIKDYLDTIKPDEIIKLITIIVDQTTNCGEIPAPSLVDEILSMYEVETTSILEKEYDKAANLIQAILERAPEGENSIITQIDVLEQIIRNWDRIAQPLQVNNKARGVDHIPSLRLAYSLRSLGVDLFNDYNYTKISERLLSLTKELFSELPEISTKSDEDEMAMKDILSQREQRQKNNEEWENEIRYEANIGALFKSKLSISANGASWGNKHFPLDNITRTYWGAVKHSVNGIPTGTTYHIIFGDNHSIANVETKRFEVYENFTERLWKAVGLRLTFEILDLLKNGQPVSFGDAIIRDDALALQKHSFFKKETVMCSWKEVHIWNASGHFCIGSQADKNTYSQLSYINTPNTHVLENLIRYAFKKGFNARISEAFFD